MTADQLNNPLFVSNVFTGAVEKAALYTAMVDARKRLPVSGVLIAPDLLLSVDHGLEKEDDIPVLVNASQAVGKVIGRDSGLDLAVLRLDHALTFEESLTIRARTSWDAGFCGRETGVGWSPGKFRHDYRGGPGAAYDAR